MFGALIKQFNKKSKNNVTDDISSNTSNSDDINTSNDNSKNVANVVINAINQTEDVIQNGYQNIKSTSDSLLPSYIRDSIPHYDKIRDFIAGFMLGSITGYVVGKGMRKAVTICGSGLATLQVLTYFGYVETHWSKLREDLYRPFTGMQTSPSEEEVKSIQKRISEFTQKMPCGAGVSTGFLWGFTSS